LRIRQATELGCRTFILGLAVLWPLGSCVTTSKSDLSEEEQRKLAEYAAEVEVGRNMAGRLLQFYGTISDADVVKYVNRIGRYVASFSDYPDRRYMFNIIDSEEVNAFACPGGYILVTLGTMRSAENEAELAAILGHEVAHVGLQHMFKTLKSMDEEDLKKEAKSVDKKGSADISMAVKVRERPSTTNNEVANIVARYAAGAAGASLSVLNAAKAGMSVILDKGLDPMLEFEADREGTRYAVRAGYRPFSILDFFSRLDERKKKLDMKTLGKTHPSLEKRRKNVLDVLQELKAKEIVGAVAEKRFAFFQKQLPQAKRKK
jgi:predicted Zn-dependent protease